MFGNKAMLESQPTFSYAVFHEETETVAEASSMWTHWKLTAPAECPFQYRMDNKMSVFWDCHKDLLRETI